MDVPKADLLVVIDQLKQKELPPESSTLQLLEAIEDHTNQRYTDIRQVFSGLDATTLTHTVNCMLVIEGAMHSRPSAFPVTDLLLDTLIHDIGKTLAQDELNEVRQGRNITANVDTIRHKHMGQDARNLIRSLLTSVYGQDEQVIRRHMGIIMSHHDRFDFPDPYASREAGRPVTVRYPRSSSETPDTESRSPLPPDVDDMAVLLALVDKTERAMNGYVRTIEATGSADPTEIRRLLDENLADITLDPNEGSLPIRDLYEQQFAAIADGVVYAAPYMLR